MSVKGAGWSDGDLRVSHGGWELGEGISIAPMRDLRSPFTVPSVSRVIQVLRAFLDLLVRTERG